MTESMHEALTGMVFDSESAASYVRDLFKYVLDREIIGSEELTYWTEYLIDKQKPGELLRLFSMSEENLKRKQSAGGSFPPGHFYSPIVSVSEVEENKDRIFTLNEPAEVKLNMKGQEDVFRKIAQHARSLPFTDEPADGIRYHYDNTSYGFGDAFVYWGMISEFRPRQVIEIGCGYTSGLILDAIDVLDLETICTFIDPYPELLKKVASPIPPQHRIVEDRVQNVNPSIVDALAENDILFVDSSHVVKTGSDVHFELFELLPRLRQGVVVHFHDAFFPFEYPKDWVIGERKSWNELYFLRAFLMYNNSFEILYFNHCFAKCRADTLRCLPIETASRILLNPGGGLWIRRV
jgi:hypothetical protein